MWRMSVCARLRSVFIRLREIVSIGISRLACFASSTAFTCTHRLFDCAYICISFECADFPSSPTIVICCVRLSTSFFFFLCQSLSRCVSFLIISSFSDSVWCFLCAWSTLFLFLTLQSHSFTAQTISWVCSV